MLFCYFTWSKNTIKPDSLFVIVIAEQEVCDFGHDSKVTQNIT